MWESSTPCFCTSASDAITFFSQNTVLVLCLCCHCRSSASGSGSAWRIHWLADVRQIILCSPRAELLVQKIIKHWLLLFFSMHLERRLKEQGLELNPRLHYCLDMRYKWTEGNSSISGDGVFTCFENNKNIWVCIKNTCLKLTEQVIT